MSLISERPTVIKLGGTSRLNVTDEPVKPERLELLIHRSSPWPYILLGALFGAGIEMLVILPLDAVFRNLFDYIFAENPIRLHYALAHLGRPGEWPMFSLTGFILGAALGFVFYRLKQNQKRLQNLRQEFEIQVAALRHHYKNLALGINGFSARARRKLAKLQPQLHDCALPDADIKVEIDALEQSLTIVAEASQRLSSILTEELRFLKALQSNGLTPSSQDFFPVLRHAIQDLLELRFREKKIRVEINGQPLTEPCAPMALREVHHLKEAKTYKKKFLEGASLLRIGVESPLDKVQKTSMPRARHVHMSINRQLGKVRHEQPDDAVGPDNTDGSPAYRSNQT